MRDELAYEELLADDYAASTSTTGVVAVGGSSTGHVETAGDADWFKVTLTAGQTYRFDLEGADTGQGTLPDPFMRLRDSTGSILLSDDDAGTGFNSRISFTATSGGNYYLSVGSSTAGGTGTYRISATDMTPTPPSDDYADSFTDTTAPFGQVTVGGSATGTLEVAGDTDWFQITLTAGSTYQFDMEGSATGDGTMSDPFLRIRDSGGISLAFDDDAGTGTNARISNFTASSGGTYYLSGGTALTAGETGTYRISATDTTPTPPSDDYADSFTDTTAPFGQVM